MTAIAAVLALSSTPLAAQDATSAEPPLVEAPATEPNPAPATEPAADPLAPEPAAESSTPVTIAVEAAPANAASAAKPVARKAATKTVRTTQRSAPRASAPATSVEAAASAMPAVDTPAHVPLAAAETPPEVVPAAQKPQQNDQLEAALPVAGGAGALILALAGAGMAVRRRKRREDEEMTLDRQTYAENTEAALMPIEEEAAAPEWSEPVIQPKPAPVVPARMQATEVSEDFDTSDFGRHVQAAYRGPTPENPSLSLRKRLKIAGELDRRERKLGTTSKPREEPLNASKPVTAFMPASDKPIMSFGGTATQAKRPEYQL